MTNHYPINKKTNHSTSASPPLMRMPTLSLTAFLFIHFLVYTQAFGYGSEVERGIGDTFCVQYDGTLLGDSPVNIHSVKEKLTVVRCNQEGVSSSSPAASGWFVDDINTTGWSRLYISTSTAYPDTIQAYSAGLLEGQLTTQRIYEYITNVIGDSTGFSSSLQAFVNQNLAYLKDRTTLNGTDPYWHQVTLLLLQLDGLYEGYLKTAQADQYFDQSVFYAVQLVGEMDDLCAAYGCDEDSAVARRIRETGNTHCSVIIKLLPGWQDIYSAHTTWSTYETMTRIYKVYDFPFQLIPTSGTVVPGRKIFFSSYPATLYSIDDFYQINTGLMVTETTLNNENDLLWQNIKPVGQVPNWIRTMLANRLATTGPSWMENYKRFNSGTYNNQWIIVDYNQFKRGSGLFPGTLTVGEQMPGYFVYEDMTQWLISNSNWVSYNRPFFPLIFNVSGQPAMVAKYGDHFTWDKTARAVLFSSLQKSVIDEDSLQRVIRWNDFQNDAIAVQGCTAGRSASNAISERGDLTPDNADCLDEIAQQDEGGTDAKYVTYQLMMGDPENMQVMAQSGPTHDILPPFVWSESPFADQSHIGQPDLWNFDWVLLSSHKQP